MLDITLRFRSITISIVLSYESVIGSISDFVFTLTLYGLVDINCIYNANDIYCNLFRLSWAHLSGLDNPEVLSQ